VLILLLALRLKKGCQFNTLRASFTNSLR